VRAGPSNAIGFLVGSTGTVWGFGYSGLVSTSSAQIGNGSYVTRARPTMVLAKDASGSVDGGNWYLDLDTNNVDTIPAALVPSAVGLTRLYGSDSGLSLDATMKYKSADYGKRVNNYVFARVPPAFFNYVQTAPGTWTIAQMKAKAGSEPVLAQLTPSGWTNVQGQLLAYSQSTANAAGAGVNILNGINATVIPGARFCIGYGENSGSMLSFQSLSEVLVLEGASSSVGGVPCVLTGLYLEGPPSSTSGTTVAFNSSVVGLSPTGSVQFQDGSSALGSAVTLTTSSDAVGTGSISTALLTVGEHSISANYSGDSQNAAASAAIPVRHTVVNATPGQTQTSLAGPTSSDEGSEVAFTATVAGNQVTGTVQFKDGATNLGAAAPLVGGVATLRISTLALGSHSIVAAFVSDNTAANAASTSSAVAHTVYSAFTTSVSLTSNSSTISSGSPVTLTATVTGSNPTGTVIFRDGATSIGSATLVNGVASITASSLDAGEHVITAEYSGDSNNQGVTSVAIFQQVSAPSVFAANPASLEFGGQSMNTTAPALTVTFTNGTTSPATISAVTASTYFAVTHNCTSLAAGASCTASVSFTPTAQGSLNGTVTVTSSAGTTTVPVTGTGEKSLVTHYYRSILRRAPDTGGKAFWDAEATRVQALGVNVNEVWFAMAGSFYFSAEYLAFNRDNAGFVTDLYGTFFNRPPDTGGFSDWTTQLAAGMPREVVLASFMFSSEFAAFTQGIFGPASTRKEVDTVVDFFRGLLARLPDDGGLNFWVQQFRAAQCQGGAAVNAQVESISSQFALGSEYTARSRSNSQYVGDLYNAFLRRGGDLGGVQFWIGEITTAARTRENVRQAFVASPEFQARVAAVIAQGCLQ
jgi:hypothetical protein